MAQVTKKSTAGATVHMVAAGSMPATTTTTTTTIDPISAMMAAIVAASADEAAGEAAVEAAVEAADPLVKARDAYVSAATSADMLSGFAAMDYALVLNAVLPEGWTLILPTSDKSENGKKVRREQKALFNALKLAKHSNPAQAWLRVRKAAEKAIGAAMTEEEKAEAAEEKETSKKTMYQRVQAALAGIVTKLGDADADHKKEIEALALIIKALPVK
jgi:hypothetical protein